MRVKGGSINRYPGSTNLCDCPRQTRIQGKGRGGGVKNDCAWGGATGTSDPEKEGDKAVCV